MEEIIQCYACGKDAVRDIRPEEFEYKSQKMTVNLPGWYCTSCDESTHYGKDGDVIDQALLIMKADEHNLLKPKEIKKMSRITFDVSNDQHSEIKALAATKGLSIKEFFLKLYNRAALEDAIDELDDPERRKKLKTYKNAKELWKDIGV